MLYLNAEHNFGEQSAVFSVLYVKCLRVTLQRDASKHP